MKTTIIEMCFLFMVLSLRCVSGETRKGNFYFGKTKDDKTCKDANCWFKIYTESPISCAIACKANKLCTGFFYQRSSKHCTLAQSNEFQFGEQIGSSYYQAFSDDKGIQSTSVVTAVRTTALTITTLSSVERTTTFLTSKPKKISTWPLDSIDDIWAEWNSSFYKIVYGRSSFKHLNAMCSNSSKNNHLAWIDGSDENKYLATFMKSEGFVDAYIGFLVNAVSDELQYHQTRSEPVSFKLPWLKSAYEKGKECVTIDQGGQWYSADCYRHNSAICEKESQLQNEN